MYLMRLFLLLVFCSQASIAISGGAEGEPACPPGRELGHKNLCFNKCAADYTVTGPLCIEQCKPNFHDAGTACKQFDSFTKNSYDRSPNSSPVICAPSQDTVSTFCFPKCQNGFYANESVCSEVTPPGWTDAGLFFWKLSYYKLDILWRTVSIPYLETRFKGKYIREASAAASCMQGQELKGTLCYPLCTSGYASKGNMCYEQCPSGYIDNENICTKISSYAKKSYPRGIGIEPPGDLGYCDYKTPEVLSNGIDRTYDKSAWLMTHNSYSNFDDGVLYAQQTFSVLRQLEGSVRAINLDIYDHEGRIQVCHKSCELDGITNSPSDHKRLLTTVLRDIKVFLTSNPREVVTIIFESSGIGGQKIKKAFDDVNLTSYIYDPRDTSIIVKHPHWPTLKDMIKYDKRLVVFSQNENDSFIPGVMPQFQFTVENTYDIGLLGRSLEVTARSESSRLSSPGKLFVMNHFRGTSFLKLDLLNASENDNTKEKLSNRIDDAFFIAKKYPNFIVVNNYHVPHCEAFKAVKKINDSF